MPRHIDAWMDGVGIASVGPILIRQVREDPPVMEIQTGERPGRYGQRVLSKKRQSLKVTLECNVLELFDLGNRSRAVEELAAWAHGSILELSNHHGRRLHCYCSAEPSLGEVRDYTADVRVELTADTVPYWEDKTPTVVTMSGASGTGNILIPGTVESPIVLTVEPTGGELTTFSVTAGGSTVELSGLSVPADGLLEIKRDVRDDLAITYGGASQLSHRSAASADDLMIPPGIAAFSFTANVDCNVTIESRGRWA